MGGLSGVVWRQAAKADLVQTRAVLSRKWPEQTSLSPATLCWACKCYDQPLPCYLRASLETFQTFSAWFLCSASSSGQPYATGPSLGPVMRAHSSHSSLPQPYQPGHTEAYSQPDPPGLQSGPSPPPRPALAGVLPTQTVASAGSGLF